MLGTIELEELSAPETEVWIQIIGTDSYRHFKTEEKLSKSDLDKRERINGKIIRMDFVEGKTIL
jgi:predicted RNA-binding protein